jgi:DNA polymerase-3 subunit gamma/tau
VSASKKVYIIDEVHMLSKAAFNALLKTLEEPPEHIVFILATTDADKLPATIISRTQRYGFRAISEPDAVKHLAHIAKEEGIKIDEPSLQLIAQRGDGSFRDSISLLDQLASLADNKEGITTELIESALGLAPEKVIEDILAAVNSHDITNIAQLLQSAQNDGISAITLTQQLTLRLRDLIVEKPELVSLLDALLDVARNSQPSLKLLSVLGSAALDHKPVKSAALSAPVLEVSATIEELTKQATKIKPSIIEKVATQTSSTSRAHLKPEAQSASEPDLSRGAKPLSKGSERKSGDAKPFDWEALIAHVRENYVALYSVLNKCKHELEGSALTIYTNSNFYQKKLNDPKYNAHLYESLEALGFYQLTVHTLPTAPPPRGSQAAAIAAIMGGGEEVSLEAA